MRVAYTDENGRDCVRRVKTATVVGTGLLKLDKDVYPIRTGNAQAVLQQLLIKGYVDLRHNSMTDKRTEFA